MAVHILCKYLGYPKIFPFMWLPTGRCTLVFFLFIFLILSSKVHAVAINDLQYREGKMAMMSEMSQKWA